jgi:hypothetical protein
VGFISIGGGAPDKSIWRLGLCLVVALLLLWEPVMVRTASAASNKAVVGVFLQAWTLSVSVSLPAGHGGDGKRRSVVCSAPTRTAGAAPPSLAD